MNFFSVHNILLAKNFGLKPLKIILLVRYRKAAVMPGLSFPKVNCYIYVLFVRKFGVFEDTPTLPSKRTSYMEAL